LGRKKGSYKFEKRQKELKKQKKKQEKLARRQNKGDEDTDEQPVPEGFEQLFQTPSSSSDNDD
jgi:hypothetical protein